MSSVSTETDVMRFHLSLNVNDLPKSVHFLTALFGCEPKKFFRDYAKFEPEELPLVLTLEPRATPAAPLCNTAGEGPLNHIGLRMTDSAKLVDIQRRLEEAGFTTQREEGVECCYAKQTKFWVLDPDHTMWEVYVLEEDIEHRGAGRAESSEANLVTLHSQPIQLQVEKPKATLTHRLSQDFPADLAGESLDEVMLQGSFNAKRHEGAWGPRLAAIQRALRPGGKLTIHSLTSNQPLTAPPALPGPASVVESVPVLADVTRMLREAGFTNFVLRKYGSKPCFMLGDAELRETLIEAVKEGEAAQETFEVMYKGPAERVGPIAGVEFPLGERVTIPCTLWKQIEASGMAEAFVKFSSSMGGASCGAGK